MLPTEGVRIVTWTLTEPVLRKKLTWLTRPYKLPRLVSGYRVHAGLLIALAAAAFAELLLFRTVLGFSMREAIQICEEITGRAMDIQYTDAHRIGDHQWWISNLGKFEAHYPEWRLTWDLRSTIESMTEAQGERLQT